MDQQGQILFQASERYRILLGSSTDNEARAMNIKSKTPPDNGQVNWIANPMPLTKSQQAILDYYIACRAVFPIHDTGVIE